MTHVVGMVEPKKVEGPWRNTLKGSNNSLPSLWHPHCGSLQQLVEVQASRALLAFYY